MNIQQHHLEEYEEKKKEWETNWSDVEFSPTWRISKISPEVQDATVVSWCVPRAKFLLLYATNRGSRLEFEEEERLQKEALAYIKATFTPFFEITEIKQLLSSEDPPTNQYQHWQFG